MIWGCAEEENGDNQLYPDCTTTIAPSGSIVDDQDNVQTALIGASEGDIICLAEGTFTFSDELSLDVDNVEIRGAGMELTILDFSQQERGANGIAVTSDGFTASKFSVRDTPGDGLRVTGATDVTFLELEVTWADGPKSSNGAYGLYPVQCTNVHIEGCKVSYASDAGVYVGQSTNILVKDNEVFGNVAGIEVENSSDAEVVGNNTHDNTGGILIFDLPGLPVQGGKRSKVHQNTIVNNNQSNFAPEGNIVGQVPAGTGILVLSSDLNEFHDNTISDNQSVGIAIISYFMLEQDFDPSSDPAYDPYPESNYTHDNTFSNNGNAPKGLALVIAASAQASKIEPMIWDGIVDTDKDNSDGSLNNCFKDNGDATWRNLDAGNNFENTSTDPAPYTCEGISLPNITP